MSLKISLRRTRQLSQLIFFGLWYYLFYRSYSSLSNLANSAVVPDIFLRSDPLAGVVGSGAARAFGQEAVWWLPLIALTIIFGRFFCGWICPLGTWLDIYDHIISLWNRFILKLNKSRSFLANKRVNFRRFRHVKYFILAAILGAALFSTSLSGYADPLCILTRAFSFAFQPVLGVAAHAATGGHMGLGHENGMISFFRFNLFAALCFAAILFISRFSRRFWCRSFCPLGALYSATAGFSALKLSRKHDRCHSCNECAAGCKMAAIDFRETKGPDAGFLKGECILCFDCVELCPKQAMRVSLGWKQPHNALSNNLVEEPARRNLIKSLLAGAVAAPLATLDPLAQRGENRDLIRPPFSRVNDNDFMALCTRCGECMHACPSNTLQPLYLMAGIEGLMTPVITPDIGGCLPDCNACGKICPTNAILPFTLEEKHTIKMGTAKLERDRCICWTENLKCSACVGVCPTMAIKETLDRGIYKPVTIVSAECTGCALCVVRCNQIIANGSACVVSSLGRGVPADFSAIRRNMLNKKDRENAANTGNPPS